MSVSDGSIAMMQSVTGASSDTCKQYLQATHGDVDAAVELYFAAGGGDSAPVEQPRRTSPPPDDIGHVTPQVATTLSDGGGGGGGGGGRYYGGGGYGGGYGGGGYGGGGYGGGGRGAPNDDDDAGYFGAAPANPMMDMEQQLRIANDHLMRLSGGQQSTTWSSRVGRSPPPAVVPTALDGMFAPPPYALRGAFKDALRAAQRNEQWLLVVLTGDDFASGCLNRDILRNDVVSQLLQCSFVLWEDKVSSPAGREVAELYRVNDRALQTPVMLIIHPLSRAEVRVISHDSIRTTSSRASRGEPFDPQRVQDVVLRFMDTNKPPTLPPNAAVLSDSPTPPSTPPAAPSRPAMPSRPVNNAQNSSAYSADAETEEDMIAAAIAASEQEYAREQEKRRTPPPQPAPAHPIVVEDATPPPARAPEPEPPKPVPAVDLDSLQSTDADAMKLKVRLASGAWQLSLPRSLPLTQFVDGVRTRMAREGVADTSTLSLLVGFPPKKIYDSTVDTAPKTTLGEITGLRSGDLVTPHT
jgi:hypothetical protein